MTAVLCPTDCDHEYDFPHTIITHTRLITVAGESVMESATFITCRACSHWLDFSGLCRCAFLCHEMTGTFIVRNAVDAVN
jgi:hypothetical protein